MDIITERIPCKECGALILPATYERNAGSCALCDRGIKMEACELCGKESSVLSMIKGKKTCLKCNMKLSVRVKTQWKNVCSTNYNSLDIKSLQIKPYPDFEEVFTQPELKGFYYPLCTVSYKNKDTNQNFIFHIVSSNGLWLDEDKITPELNNSFSVFQLKGDKYQFNGHLKSFVGYEYIPVLKNYLDQYFKENGKNYQDSQEQSAQFVAHIQLNYPGELNSFDSEYYITTFFNYHIRKAKSQEKKANNQLTPFKSTMHKDFFTPYNHKNFLGIGEEIIINEKHFDYPAQLMQKIPIGACWADKYFQEENNTFTFYDPAEFLVYFINQNS